MHVANLQAGALTGQTAGAQRRQAATWVRPDSGLFWSMNCDSWLVPKNSLIAATTGRMLIRVCGVIASTSWVVIRSRTTRSMRDRPTRIWFWISSPTVRRRRLPKWSMSSTSTGTSTPPGAVIVAGAPVSAARCSRTRYSIVATMSSSVSVELVIGLPAFSRASC